MSVKLQNCFLKVLLPEVVRRKNGISVDNKQKCNYICCRPSSKPMIACDAKHYYYACVNIKIIPKGSWF